MVYRFMKSSLITLIELLKLLMKWKDIFVVHGTPDEIKRYICSSMVQIVAP